MDSSLRWNDVLCLGWIPAFAGMTGYRKRWTRGEETGFALQQNRKAKWSLRTVAREGCVPFERSLRNAQAKKNTKIFPPSP